MCIRLISANTDTARRTIAVCGRVQHVSLSSSAKESTKNNSQAVRSALALEARQNDFRNKT